MNSCICVLNWFIWHPNFILDLHVHIHSTTPYFFVLPLSTALLALFSFDVSSELKSPFIFSLFRAYTEKRKPRERACNLTLSQITHLTLPNWKTLQTSLLIWWKWQKVLQTERNHCGKRRSCSSFSHSVFNRLLLQIRKTRGLFGKRLMHPLFFKCYQERIWSITNRINFDNASFLFYPASRNGF